MTPLHISCSKRYNSDSVVLTEWRLEAICKYLIEKGSGKNFAGWNNELQTFTHVITLAILLLTTVARTPPSGRKYNVKYHAHTIPTEDSIVLLRKLPKSESSQELFSQGVCAIPSVRRIKDSI
jgi:hypothetical protein